MATEFDGPFKIRYYSLKNDLRTKSFENFSEAVVFTDFIVIEEKSGLLGKWKL